MHSRYMVEWISTASIPELLFLLDKLSEELDGRELRDSAARVRDARESVRQARIGQLEKMLKEDRNAV